MKILVISDTHRHIRNVIDLVTKITDVDRIIHLGDLVADAQDIESIYGRIPIDYVSGNCDFYETIAPKEKIISLLGKKILITHGHYYGVKSGYKEIGSVALQKQVDAVLFGHTHVPYIGYVEDVILMNPGSISEPRRSMKPSYGILEIDDKGVLHATLNTIK
ncbi:MAG: metallophosphoesterase [Firmicutes bacterium HGW-Firmicutes-1]|jgi:hypothetical protein|nr:MAG: metallophosphoesterase [Firmicutes bacterium HGW-Firmicutes-1]